MRVYDYQCEDCGETAEHFVANSEVTTVECPACGGTANRLITGTRFKLPGDDPDFPTAWDQWGKRQEKRVKAAEKKSAEHGEP